MSPMPLVLFTPGPGQFLTDFVSRTIDNLGKIISSKSLIDIVAESCYPLAYSRQYVLVGGTWLVNAGDIQALSKVLREYQEKGTIDQLESRLAIALARVVENRVRPSLVKKLRPQDVDDVCSEVILGFWRFRHSVRPEEVGKLIQTLKHRRSTDQVRVYYREYCHQVSQSSDDEMELLALLPARNCQPGTDASQNAWDLICELDLRAKDRVIAYAVYLGTEKSLVARVLNIDSDTVTNSIKRCREALLDRGYRSTEDRLHV